ncbi:Ubiquitin-like domain superfamily [Sesbania bispinosa]|nr:Ubiquitin-like domain superfamily [Sesbania bispinosa]
MSSGVTNNEGDKKPTDQGAHINLKVKGQDGMKFLQDQEKYTTEKLMNAYCDRQSVDFNSIVFLFDGLRLRAEQTPNELEMEDGDEIDAMLHQTGGNERLGRDNDGEAEVDIPNDLNNGDPIDEIVRATSRSFM